MKKIQKTTVHKPKTLKLEEGSYDQFWRRLVKLVDDVELSDCADGTPSQLFVLALATNLKSGETQVVRLARCDVHLKIEASTHLF